MSPRAVCRQGADTESKERQRERPGLFMMTFRERDLAQTEPARASGTEHSKLRTGGRGTRAGGPRARRWRGEIALICGRAAAMSR